MQSEGQTVLGWRTVPTNNSIARRDREVVRAVHAAGVHRPQPGDCTDEMAFERKLYVIRKRAYSEIRTSTHRRRGVLVHLPACRTRPRLQRHADSPSSSTSTSPTCSNPRWRPRWRWCTRASAPTRSRAGTARTRTATSRTTARSTRCAATSTGCTRARRCSSRELFGDDIKKILPIINPNGSDSAMFDNALELLVLAGRSLPHAMMMMIPEPWSNHESMDDEKRAFYEYHSCLMEPWDGPASIAFTDGKQHRRGARPQRPAPVALLRDQGRSGRHGVRSRRARHSRRSDIVHKGRLQPGRMFLVDTEQGRIVDDEEIKRTIASEQSVSPSGSSEHLVHLERSAGRAGGAGSRITTRCCSGRSRSATRSRTSACSGADGARTASKPSARWATTRRWRCSRTSRGCCTTISSSCSRRSRTRPSTASARRSSPRRRCGSARKATCCTRSPADCRRLELKGPILTNEEFAKVRRMNAAGAARSACCRSCSAPTRGEKGLAKSMEELCLTARRLIEEEEVNVLILSDRGVNKRVRADAGAARRRGPASLPDPRRPAHARQPRAGDRRGARGASLRAADRLRLRAINPYLAFETIDEHDPRRAAHRASITRLACKNFVKAATKGVIKVMSKMGISAIQSYRGAQVFEAVGLRQDVIDEYFTWTPSRVGGIGMDVIAQEVLMRHRAAFPDARVEGHTLPVGGQYQWRSGRRVPSVQSRVDPSPAEGGAQRQLPPRSRVLRELVDDAGDAPRDAARAARVQARRAPCRSTKSSRSRAS